MLSEYFREKIEELAASKYFKTKFVGVIWLQNGTLTMKKKNQEKNILKNTFNSLWTFELS